MEFPLDDDHTELDALLDKVFAALDEENIETIYKSLDFFWARLAMHIRAEHLHLFPAIINALETQATENNRVPPLDEAQNAIKELQDDHNFFMRELSAMIKLLREWRENKTIANLSKQIAGVRERMIVVKRQLETHNETEETEVYLWADRLLSLPECAALNERMQLEINNLPPRFGTGADFCA